MSESTSFVRLFVGFLLSVAGVHASCPIELSPPRVVVKYGDPVSINCSTSEREFEGMGWEARQGGTSLQKVEHLTWTVPRVTDWKANPLCYINPLSGSNFTQCEMGPKIVVYTFPETISISSSSDLYGDVMREGDEYNFTCSIQNVAPVQNLTVRWYKGDNIFKTVTFDNRSKEPVNQTSVISFRPTKQDNGVTFRCKAHLDLGPEGPQFNESSEQYKVKVYFGPYINCSHELLEGEPLEKKCSVIGNPTPYVKWKKNGETIDATVALTRKDAGNYTIEAEGLSVAQETLHIPVFYGPELSCPSTYIVLENEPHNLTCTLAGYPPPEKTMYKDGEEVELLDKLTRRDGGQYVVSASNQVSTVTVTVDITVQYPPTRIAELMDSEVDAGSTVSLKCSSTGNPRPSYSWDYYRTDNVMEKNEDGVSRLVIHNVTVYNMGSYTCRAGNHWGNVSKTAKLTVKGPMTECPIELTPDRMVIQYQSRGQIATCKSTPGDARHQDGEIYWQVHEGFDTVNSTWLVDTEKDWNARPVCIGTFKGRGQCQRALNFTLYKPPDSVSIRPVHNSSTVEERREFNLQCDITNVAPARNLIVMWYQGDEDISSTVNASLQVTGCLPKNSTDCDIGVALSPLNVSSTIKVTLDRTHNGVFRCSVNLDLGPTELDPPAVNSSDLNITVYYKPKITSLQKKIPLFRGYPEELLCEAEGNPPPRIQWHSTNKVLHVSGDTLTVSEEGIYSCNATNEIDSVTFEVEVILTEDYLPLIAGFVAVTVVAIIIIFLFIYSIYYKNTKMRRYSLKNPKLSTHNGNVAHNGWDMQFPMTKLS